VQPPEQQPQAAAQPDTLTNIVRAGLKDPNRFDDVMKVAKGSLGIDDFTTVDPNSPAGKRVASFINSANGNPGFTPTGGTAGQPAPAPQTFAQRADQAFTPFQNGGVALRAPAASDLEARARQFENNANVASRRAASIGGFEGQGPAAAALEKYAEGQMAQAKLLREQIAKQQEQTTEEKNVSSGATAQTELVKSNIKRGELAYGGITSQATQWERDLKPYNDIAKAVVNDPSTWTGIGAEARLDVNKLIAIYGDKKGAMMQEALQKVRASSVLGQMNVMRDQMQEAGSQSGRIFAQYADLAQQASPGMETTLGGNRFLVNVQSRMGELSSKVAQEARTYKAAHGYLDAGWDQHLANYMQTNSPFTKAEMAEPALLGAPTMPAFNDPKKVAAWAASMGVRPGEPVRTQTGRYVVPIPAPRQAPAQPAQPAGQGMLQPGQT
jgi:hypothetical protein